MSTYFTPLLACLLLVGCREGTSVLVTVDFRDLLVPDQIATLHLRVTNPEIDATHPTFDSQQLTLCSPTETKTCYSLPFTVTLRPGDSSPNALVRIEVIALDRGGNEVVHDAASFRFFDGASQALAFHLSPACLKTYCAAQDRACGPNGGCVDASLGSAGTGTYDGGQAPGKIERWFQSTQIGRGSGGRIVLDIPTNAQPGDLVVALAPPTAVAKAGWTVVGRETNRQIAYHRIAVADTADTYTFDSIGRSDWMEVSYRGVTQVIIGTVASLPSVARLDMTSMDVPRGGAWLVTELGTSGSAACLHDGIPPVFHSGSNQVDEQPNLVAGPTGVRTYDCTTDPDLSLSLGAELLLVP